MTEMEFEKEMTTTNYMISKQISEEEMSSPVLLWNRVTEIESKRTKLIEMFEEVEEIFVEREILIAENDIERADEIEDMYWDLVDVYGNAMTELQKYDEDFYDFCDEVLMSGNEVDRVARNAIYCLMFSEIPEDVQ